MKTATVRELRNDFARLAKWLEWGERINITRNGRIFATLAPALQTRSKEELRAAWKKRSQNYQPAGKKVGRVETDALWSRLRD